jgi:hypothetical protein
MIRSLFVIIFLFLGWSLLRADQTLESDQDFLSQLDRTKNPFEDGYPKPVPVVVPVKHEEPKPVIMPKPAAVPVITLPSLKAQGVIVGEGIQQAIINDKIVPLQGTIEGAQVIAVTKEGVAVLFKGKKFFLKVD